MCAESDQLPEGYTSFIVPPHWVLCLRLPVWEASKKSYDQTKVAMPLFLMVQISLSRIGPVMGDRRHRHAMSATWILMVSHAAVLCEVPAGDPRSLCQG